VRLTLVRAIIKGYLTFMTTLHLTIVWIHLRTFSINSERRAVSLFHHFAKAEQNQCVVYMGYNNYRVARNNLRQTIADLQICWFVAIPA